MKYSPVNPAQKRDPCVPVCTPHFPHDSAPEKLKELYPVDEIELRPNVSSDFRDKAREATRKGILLAIIYPISRKIITNKVLWVVAPNTGAFNEK